MDQAAPVCPLCVWFVLAFVALVFAAVLWRNRRERITRLDLRGDKADEARKAGP